MKDVDGADGQGNLKPVWHLIQVCLREQLQMTNHKANDGMRIWHTCLAGSIYLVDKDQSLKEEAVLL